MTRRTMFRALLGTPMIVPKPTDSRPMMSIVPMCPQCGLFLTYETLVRPNPVDSFEEWYQAANTRASLFLTAHPATVTYTVRCGCGWSGTAPYAIPIPLSHKE